MSFAINFAKALGIESLPAAIVFMILYVALFAFFVYKSFTQPTTVHYMATSFSLIRVVTFAIRVALTSSKSAEQSLGVVIAEQVLSGVGYFGLLFSSYLLVMDRLLLTDAPPSNRPIVKLTHNRTFFRVLLLVAVILGIASAAKTNSNGNIVSSSKSLHIASTIMFLVLTVVQVLHTIHLSRTRISEQSQYYMRGKDSLGVRHGNHILLVVSLLLLLREIFATATVTNATKQENEHFWYPLISLPEILVVLLYTIPGLVPRRDELPGNSPVEVQRSTESKEAA